MNSFRSHLFLLIFLCCFVTGSGQYVPDVLGGHYLYRSIQMPNDYEGKVICTLVKKPQLPDVHRAVLYLHGYNDYFFQKQLGDSINAHGYNFYALDLRKYGRSLLPNQTAFFCKDLQEYFADLDTALAVIRKEGNDEVVLMAHSTGGLIVSDYLKARKAEALVAGVLLNSPFLDWNFGWFMENIVLPTVSFIGRFFPNLTVQGYGNASYAHSLLKAFKGEWEYNTAWKMINGFPKKAGWIRAIHEAQKRIQKGNFVQCPVLVLSSDRSFPETAEWHEAYHETDIVLDVHDIQHYGKQLGKQVICDTIAGGIHDLILSRPAAREQTYCTIFDWLRSLDTVSGTFPTSRRQ